MRRFMQFALSWDVPGLLMVVYLFCLVLAASGAIGCAEGTVSDPGQASSGIVACGVSRMQYPTTREDFDHIYNGRGFYSDGNHLGRDIRLAEGAPIHPIACGTVRVYRPASGYGTLAVVIEHRLASPMVVQNGLGESVTVTGFLSIYGHLRTTSLIRGGTTLALRVGDTVGPDDLIGFVQNDALNGDGAEHLHLGIRLQTLADAQRTDTDFFRGYDTAPSQRRWFADPAVFLPAVMSGGMQVRWHPAGTVIAAAYHPGEYWMIGNDEQRHAIDPTILHEEALESSVITVAPEEVGCYEVGTPYRSFRSSHRLEVTRFRDSTVWELDYDAHEYRAFISYEAFQSWGWTDAQIHVDTRANMGFVAFSEGLDDAGYRLMRDGTLVKGRGQSEVAVVSNGRRLPIVDWATFLALGYRADRIVEIDPATLDEVASPRGPLITADLVQYCAHPSACLDGNCDAGRVGGGGVEDASAAPDAATSFDAGSTGTDASAPPDVVIAPDVAVRPSETCNGLDDDGNGLVDEVFVCPLGRRGPTCVTSCGANGFRVCEAPACDWSPTCHSYPETCDDTIDNDCDGLTDCRDPDCLSDAHCRPIVMDAGVPPTDASVGTDASVPVDVPTSPDVYMPPTASGIRYEFRVLDSAGWSATEPFRLRDLWWSPVVCRNTASTNLELVADGWHRCDFDYRLTPFVGSFFSPPHPDWGDRGQLGTVGNAPDRCTPTAGVEWRLTELATGRVLYLGAADGLPCVHVGSQDRHGLP